MKAPRLTRPSARAAAYHVAARAPITIAVLEAAVAASESEGITCLSTRALGRQLRCSTLAVSAAVSALERAGSLVRLSDGVHALAGTPAAERDRQPTVPHRAPAHPSFLLDLRSPPW